MAKAETSPILQLIRRVAGDQRARAPVRPRPAPALRGQRDEAAFQALLLRHGPMVLEVCRGVLGNEADAEDAFQATFLILARKAGVHPQGGVAGELAPRRRLPHGPQGAGTIGHEKKTRGRVPRRGRSRSRTTSPGGKCGGCCTRS